MPAIFPDGSSLLANLRNHAAAGNEAAAALMALFDNTYYADMSAGVEASNVIKVTGQIRDQDGNEIAAVKDVRITSVPISGAGTMTDGGYGTFKVGSASTSVWLQTDSSGRFQVDVLNTAAEDNLIIAQLDNGTTEMLKLTFA